MGKGLRLAIVVEAVVLVAAFAFSAVYFSRNLYHTSHAPTVVLVVLWVLVAALLLFVFWSRSLMREEMIRRFYFNKDWVYNHEIGYASVSQIVPDNDPYELVTFVADSLARMSYGFEVADAPDDFIPEYMVSSSKLQFHKAYVEDDELEDLDEDDVPVVIDQWAGSLYRVVDVESDNGYEEIGTFANARELAQLLEDITLSVASDETAAGEPASERTAIVE